MSRRKLIWQIYPAYLAVTLVSVIAVTAYCSHSFRHVYYGKVRSELNRFALVAAEEIHMVLRAEGEDKLDGVCKEIAHTGHGEIRLTVVLPSGKVVGDSHDDPTMMMNHSDRPEIIDALQRGFGSSVRPSPTLGETMMYVAVPMREEGKPVAVVRSAIAVTEIDHALRAIYMNILWVGVVIAAGAAVLSLLISRRISRPIVSIKQTAEQFAAGELSLRVPLPASAELAALADSLNRMAAQLGERIMTITEQRNKLDAVLSSMVEGVFAVDDGGRIVSMNAAAADLLGIEATPSGPSAASPGPAQAQNRRMEEVIRNSDLQHFVRETLAGEQSSEAEIIFPGDGPQQPSSSGGRYFRVHGASLTDARGRRSGAVIVLNDMTRVRKLETIRRDFVANVSHELKTPITSIQGFVEALVEGGVKDPEQVEKYLGIIARHASRLNSIIDDLLTLSRLEETEERTSGSSVGPRAPSFARGPIRPVLEEAIDLSSVKASEKRIAVDLTCEQDVEAAINPPLLEQAALNLIDNAIKYSPEGSRIAVELRKQGEEVAIAVRDEGCGISREHLARLFERFYVVDKSRSRKLGGTGLGLAIVKHIAQAHGGYVSVESTLGKGSTFTIHLPAR
jgi:two-component system phosphate regulon sensor histidine kinase PhoR